MPVHLTWSSCHATSHQSLLLTPLTRQPQLTTTLSCPCHIDVIRLCLGSRHALPASIEPDASSGHRLQIRERDLWLLLLGEGMLSPPMPPTNACTKPYPPSWHCDLALNSCGRSTPLHGGLFSHGWTGFALISNRKGYLDWFSADPLGYIRVLIIIKSLDVLYISYLRIGP